VQDDRIGLGELESALSQTVTRVLAEYYGKGPRRVRSYLFDDYIFAVCDDVLTTAERTLRHAGEQELIQTVRLAFEDLMTKAFVTEVEKLVGRTVVGYHSQVLVDQGDVYEIFVLDPTQPGMVVPSRPRSDVRDVALAPPGRPGDVDTLPSPGSRPSPAEVGDMARPKPSHGQLRAAVGNALVRTISEALGRGPARTRVYFADEYVFCALEDPLTRVERTLVEGGRNDLVRRWRQSLFAAQRAELAAVVGDLLHRAVVAGNSQVVFDPDVEFLTFVLDAPVA
jgi:uncharacterized protein YbcI